MVQFMPAHCSGRVKGPSWSKQSRIDTGLVVCMAGDCAYSYWQEIRTIRCQRFQGDWQWADL